MKKSLKTSSYVVIAAAMVACGGGGGTAVSADPCANTTEFCAYSPSVAEGAVLAQKFASTQTSGGGQNVNPAIEIKNVPAAALYLSAVMDDEDSPCGTGLQACVHAGLFDLPKTKVSLVEDENLSTVVGVTFGGAIGLINNQYLGVGYEGPFPPTGTSHTYKMTIYAHKTPWSSGYGVVSAGNPTQLYGRPPVSRAEVLDDHGPSGDNDIVASKTITFTYVGR